MIKRSRGNNTDFFVETNDRDRKRSVRRFDELKKNHSPGSSFCHRYFRYRSIVVRLKSFSIQHLHLLEQLADLYQPYLRDPNRWCFGYRESGGSCGYSFEELMPFATARLASR